MPDHDQPLVLNAMVARTLDGAVELEFLMPGGPNHEGWRLLLEEAQSATTDVDIGPGRSSLSQRSVFITDKGPTAGEELTLEEPLPSVIIDLHDLDETDASSPVVEFGENEGSLSESDDEPTLVAGQRLQPEQSSMSIEDPLLVEPELPHCASDPDDPRSRQREVTRSERNLTQHRTRLKAEFRQAAEQAEELAQQTLVEGREDVLNEAIRAFERLIELRPEVDRAHERLGQLLLRAGARERAYIHLSTAKRLGYPVDPNLMGLIQEGGMPEGAERDFISDTKATESLVLPEAESTSSPAKRLLRAIKWRKRASS